MRENPDYGNWVPKRIIYLPLTLGLVFLAASVISFFLLVPAAFFILVAAYLSYVRLQLSSREGHVQESVWKLVIEHLDWNGEGRALDIGCGNGGLTIKLAQKYGGAEVVGSDYWGKKWEYSMNVCERNAVIEGVSDRVTFQQGSAASLPFQDEFLIKKMYGDPEELLTAIRSWGTVKVEFIQTRNSPFVPRLLKAPFILGTMGLIRGEK